MHTLFSLPTVDEIGWGIVKGYNLKIKVQCRNTPLGKSADQVKFYINTLTLGCVTYTYPFFGTIQLIYHRAKHPIQTMQLYMNGYINDKSVGRVNPRTSMN